MNGYEPGTKCVFIRCSPCAVKFIGRIVTVISAAELRRHSSGELWSHEVDIPSGDEDFPWLFAAVDWLRPLDGDINHDDIEIARQLTEHDLLHCDRA